MSSNNYLNNLLNRVSAHTPDRFSERFSLSRAASRVQGGVNNNSAVVDMQLSDIIEVEGERKEEVYEPATMVDLTSPTRSLRVNDDTYSTGTSTRDGKRAAKFLFIHTEDVEDLDGPLPNSNTISSDATSLRSDLVSARSGNSARTDLQSARSSGSTDQSVTWGSNKFAVFEVPSESIDFNALCKRKIGNGANVCIKNNCFINHRGGEIVQVKRGDILVQKTKDIAFLEPSTNSGKVSHEVLVDWLSTKKKIEEWSALFALANTSYYDDILTTAGIDQGTLFANQARTHKSPGLSNARTNQVDTDNLFIRLMEIGKESPFNDKKRSMSDDELDTDSNKERRRKLSDEEYQNVNKPDNISKLREGVDHIYKILMFLTEKLDDKDCEKNEEIQMLFTRVENVQTDLGTRATNRTDSLEAPTVWASIAVLSETVEELHREVHTIPTTSEWKKVLMKEVDRIEKAAIDTVNVIEVDLRIRVGTVLDEAMAKVNNRDIEISHLITRLESLSSDYKNSQGSTDKIIVRLAEGASLLKDELDELRHQFRANSGKGSAAPSSNNCSNYVPLTDYFLKMSLIDNDIEIMKEKIDRLISESQGPGIRAFGLGFSDRKESEKWLLDNMSDDTFGLLVDVHLVFEHIYHMVVPNEGTLKTLHSIQKLELDNMNQAYSIMSFDSRVPKILSSTHNMALPSRTSKGVSHFDEVDSFADWDRRSSGKRTVIKDNLILFERAHQQYIDSSSLGRDSHGRMMATRALQASYMWINQFVTYIDETYKTFVDLSAFTENKAWELTTQLGRRIFLEVAAPRNGISSAIQVGTNAKSQLNRLAFWPMLQSHDVMQTFREANFEDHPTISGEYVKFLTANAGGDGQERNFKELKEDLALALKKLKDNQTALATANNKIDELNTKFRDFEKRFTKAEQGFKK